jgi:hypothetical protein
MNANNMKIRRLTKKITISRSKQVLPIEVLLPGDAVECFGVQAITLGIVPSSRPVLPNFGEFALEFEGKRVHPVNFIVPYIHPSTLQEKDFHRPGLLPFHVPLQNNRLVNGFYRDLGLQSPREGVDFASYQVLFIFHLYLQ